MPVPMRTRTLHIPLGDAADDRELAVTVEGDAAVLTLVDKRSDDPPYRAAAADGPPSVTRLRVPARALVAALRVAWADEHDVRCFEPWRDDGRENRYGYRGYGYGGYWDDDDADLGDGDPAGYRDPTVVPFPYRRPLPTAPRSGHAWEPWEHDAIRETWLAAEPDADKNDLIRELAERLERGIGGVSARLRLAGCDPTRPGSAWDGTYRDADRRDEVSTPGEGEGPPRVGRGV